MPDALQRPLREALIEFKSAMEDLRQTKYRSFEGALRRSLVFLEQGRPLGDALHRTLPVVDFDVWFGTAQQTIGGMVGSGTLEWPPETPQRVKFQLDLLQRMAAGSINTLSFCRHFFQAGKYFDDNIRELQNIVVRPFYRDLQRLIEPALAEESHAGHAPPRSDHGPKAVIALFVDDQRLSELRAVNSSRVDLRRLIRLCEELNSCYSAECYLAVAMLTRAILDHVPPIFGVSNFDAVASNYRGAKSFKDSMTHLGTSARRIGDAHLHVQARAHDALPTRVQVNFSQDIDVLLAEVVRLLEAERPAS